MAQVRQTVYGTPPEGAQSAKHRGDGVVFKEAIQTWARSRAQIRFVDGSELTLGEKARVTIDEFVFDPANAGGNALIELSAGTLRWVTGAMPKGHTVIKTPTVALILRGTTVTVHVHPDGTTDAVVEDGSVDAVHTGTSQTTSIGAGQGLTAGAEGSADFPGDTELLPDEDEDGGQAQEQRRSSFTVKQIEYYRHHGVAL